MRSQISIILLNSRRNASARRHTAFPPGGEGGKRSGSYCVLSAAQLHTIGFRRYCAGLTPSSAEKRKATTSVDIPAATGRAKELIRLKGIIEAAPFRWRLVVPTVDPIFLGERTPRTPPSRGSLLLTRFLVHPARPTPRAAP